MGRLRVIKVGALATVQDEGRFGYRQYGIPQSGAMDPEAFHLANRLVGNEDDFPVLEVAMQGLVLQAEAETTVSVTGAEVSVQVNEEACWMEQRVKLQSGDVLTLSNTKNGVYTYLSIAGKMKASLIFGSYATYVMAGFGGFEGRPLKAGDVLETTETPGQPNEVEKKSEASGAIRIMKGPEWGMLKDSPDRKTFRVSSSSNRMGIRLEGDTVDIEGSEIISSAVLPGTVQLPSDGHPIILMNDCQTTGGYPRIGKVLDEDLGRLAQMRPGEEVKFRIIGNEEIWLKRKN